MSAEFTSVKVTTRLHKVVLNPGPCFLLYLMLLGLPACACEYNGHPPLTFTCQRHVAAGELRHKV